jgi:hypothetical protein
MEEVAKVERSLPREVRLLTSIKAALEEAEEHRLGYADLIDALCADEEAGWTEANHGKRITAYWLRDNLRGLLDPPGSQQWQEGKVPNRTHVRGYELHQFKDAFLRYLPADTHTATPPQPTGSSGTTATDGSKPAETAEISCTRSPGPSGTDPVQEKSSEFKEKEAVAPVVPDEPVGGRGGGESVKEGDPFAWARSGGVDTSADSAAAIIRQHLDKAGSFVLVTMVEGSPRYSFEDGTLVAGRSGKPISAEEFGQLDLEPIEGESLLEDGSPQRYVLRRQAETPSPTLAEKLAEKLGSVPQPPNGPVAAPTEPGKKRRRTSVIEARILQVKAEHPDWSDARIGKEAGRAASVVRRVLARANGVGDAP